MVLLSLLSFCGGKMLFFTDCAVSMKLPCFIFEHLKPCKCETNYENKCSTIFSDYSTCVLYICTGTNTTTQYSGVLLQILEYRIRSYWQGYSISKNSSITSAHFGDLIQNADTGDTGCFLCREGRESWYKWWYDTKTIEFSWNNSFAEKSDVSKSLTLLMLL